MRVAPQRLANKSCTFNLAHLYNPRKKIVHSMFANRRGYRFARPNVELAQRWQPRDAKDVAHVCFAPCGFRDRASPVSACTADFTGSRRTSPVARATGRSSIGSRRELPVLRASTACGRLGKSPAQAHGLRSATRSDRRSRADHQKRLHRQDRPPASRLGPILTVHEENRKRLSVSGSTNGPKGL